MSIYRHKEEGIDPIYLIFCILIVNNLYSKRERVYIFIWFNNLKFIL